MGFIYTILLAALFIISLPLQVLVAVLVFLTVGHPILFVQKRVGKNGKPFTMYKFRTMVRDAEKSQISFRRMNESSGPVFKIHNDPRFIGIGKFLSHTGLDELPQIWNVLIGDMALVGPRPLPILEERKLSPWMRERHSVLPGIISPAILTGKYHKNFTAWMKSDVAYTKSKSFWTDLILIYKFSLFISSLLIAELFRGSHR